MNISVESIPYITVFVQGLLSFFSPCVLPLLPVYLAVLSGSARKASGSISKEEPSFEAEGAAEATVGFSRGRTMLHTLFFVLGISFAFLVLGHSRG